MSRADLFDPARDDSTPAGALVIHALFDRPADYPDRVVVARDVIRAGVVERLPRIWAFETVDAARRHLAGLGLARLDRASCDVPSLVETWF
jgi:hypothetical protein